MAFPMPPLQPWGSTPLELPPEIQAVVDHIQAATQAPWDLALSPLLCAISVASQRLVEILHPITAKHIPPCLWGFSTGDSGERKSGVDAIATSPHRKFEQELELKRKKLLAAYDVDMQMYEMQRARIIGEARRRSGSFMDDDELKAELLALQERKPEEPKITRLLCSNTTVPALLESMAESGGSVGLFSPEGAVILSGHAAAQLPILNEGWDGQRIVVMRKTEKDIVIEKSGLPLSVLVQPELMSKFLRTKDDARASGFVARGLWCAPISTQGTRFINGYTQSWKCSDVQPYEDRMTALLEMSMTCKTRKLLELSANARTHWIQFYNRVEEQIGPEGRYSEIRDIASKSAEQALRIAGNYACYLGADQLIGELEIRYAISAAFFFLEQALFIFDSRFSGGYIADAEKVYRFIARRHVSHTGFIEFPQYELRQYGPNGLRKGPRVDIAVDYLISMGLIGTFKIGRQTWIRLLR